MGFFGDDLKLTSMNWYIYEKRKLIAIKELASHFGHPVNTIDWYLRRLRSENRL